MTTTLDRPTPQTKIDEILTVTNYLPQAVAERTGLTTDYSCTIRRWLDGSITLTATFRRADSRRTATFEGNLATCTGGEIPSTRGLLAACDDDPTRLVLITNTTRRHVGPLHNLRLHVFPVRHAAAHAA